MCKRFHNNQLLNTTPWFMYIYSVYIHIYI